MCSMCSTSAALQICRVGQNQIVIRIYGVHTVFWQENHHTYGHVRCVYTVLANPTNLCFVLSTVLSVLFCPVSSVLVECSWWS